jgi:hypothetical protein
LFYIVYCALKISESLKDEPWKIPSTSTGSLIIFEAYRVFTAGVQNRVTI